MAEREEVKTEEDQNAQAYEHYREMICGPRSMTPYELRAIPIFAAQHGLDKFMKAVLVVATKPKVSSPISYLETVLRNWGEEDVAVGKVFNLDEKRAAVEPASKERDDETLEREAAAGNLFAKRILRGRRDAG